MKNRVVRKQASDLQKVVFRNETVRGQLLSCLNITVHYVTFINCTFDGCQLSFSETIIDGSSFINESVVTDWNNVSTRGDVFGPVVFTTGGYSES